MGGARFLMPREALEPLLQELFVKEVEDVVHWDAYRSD